MFDPMSLVPTPQRLYRWNWPWPEVKVDTRIPATEVVMYRDGVEVQRIVNVGTEQTKSPKPIRERGYYWVKFATWVIAEWDGEHWMYGYDECLNDDYFTEIDEWRITREV